uniref:Uncharacterized protein n=1 Tax=Anguilla anguilla TaxID=7936 RepID=A0A0E9P8G2_ANGAN
MIKQSTKCTISGLYMCNSASQRNGAVQEILQNKL